MPLSQSYSQNNQGRFIQFIFPCASLSMCRNARTFVKIHTLSRTWALNHVLQLQRHELPFNNHCYRWPCCSHYSWMRCLLCLFRQWFDVCESQFDTAPLLFFLSSSSSNQKYIDDRTSCVIYSLFFYLFGTEYLSIYRPHWIVAVSVV